MGLGLKAFKGKREERDRELRLKIEESSQSSGAAPSVEMPELCLKRLNL